MRLFKRKPKHSDSTGLHIEITMRHGDTGSVQHVDIAGFIYTGDSLTVRYPNGLSSWYHKPWRFQVTDERNEK